MRYVTSLLLLATATAVAQPPQRPLIALDTWSLPGYHAVAATEAFTLPTGIEFGQIAAVTMTPGGHLLVLNRGPQPFLEFDASGTLVRSFGDPTLFNRAHGLRIDDAGNLWVTDVGLHVVYKMDADGKVLMTLGTSGQAGLWDEAAGVRLFNQPNETALDSLGNLYVVQGHGVGEPRVFKFSGEGRFIKQWGARGTGAGEFFAAHSIEVDASDTLYVADRENMRIERFDTEGNFLGEWKYNAMVCGLYLHSDGHFYITSGFDGEWAKLDAEGKLLGALGSPGKETGQFGEAHYLVLDAANNAYIADVTNRRVQVYRRED
ncbi:MAG: peptidyl-alpha-hydroxyglycine alpha-amidating lyase family protein [Pseudohongiellaceae bacterium]|jgi:DNA-binding beta-propeller fold protein YncE